MGRLRVSGQVFARRPNGKPIKNARIVIFDNDLGSSRDRIFSGRTDGEGIFRGTTRDWEDANWVETPFGVRIPTPDVLLLSFEVTKKDEKHEGAFILFPNGTSVPIVVPWDDPELFAVVNSKECFSASEAAAAIRDAIDNGTNIDIKIVDPVVNAAFLPLTYDENAMREFVRRNIPALNNFTPGSLSFAVDPFTGTALIIASVAIIISTAAAGTATVILALAVLQAIQKCEDIEARQEDPTTTVSTNGFTFGGGGIRLLIGDCRR